MSDAVVARLEAVASRLERVARKMGGGGGGGDDDEVPQHVVDFDGIMKTQLAAVLEAADGIKIPDAADILKKGFGNIKDMITATASCAKPSQTEMMTFLKPGIEAIQAADNLKMRGKKKFADHYKALYETMVGISWVTMSAPQQMPLQHADGQAQAAQFNLNRVLKACKTAGDKEAQQKFVRTLNALNDSVKGYIKEYFKTGLEWKPQGAALSGYSPGAAAPASEESKEKEAKPAKKPAKKAAGGDRGALFGELNKGLKATAGLKKVRDEDKTKNRKERPGKVTAAPKKAKKKRKKGAPVNQKKGPRWMVENHDEGVVTVDKADMKTSVYISMCDDTTVDVQPKVKSVTIDSCIKCRVFVNDVISTIELVNCKSVTLFCREKILSISVEKSESPKIVLMKPAFEAAPGVYTSNVSAMNIEIPGATEDADNVDIPVPEQFLTKIDPKTRKATTTEVTHG